MNYRSRSIKITFLPKLMRNLNNKFIAYALPKKNVIIYHFESEKIIRLNCITG